jgi:mannonate dehydratase
VGIGIHRSTTHEGETSMNRRKFIAASGVGAAAAAATVLTEGNVGFAATTGGTVEAQAARKKVLMKVGASNANAYDAASMQACLRYGVKSITARPQLAEEGRLYATVDELKKMREIPEKHGVTVDVLTPPNLASSHIDRERNPGIMLGKSPERDREIEGVQTMIKNCAAAGIPCIKYNMSLLGVLRTGRKAGRGDTSYSHFKLADAKADPPLTRAGRVTDDMYWERITYFLDRVIPVANEFKVRLACHPHDSMTPPEGYQGINAVLSTPEGLKKFVGIQDSPFHGLNLCIGTLSEMLMDPGKEVFQHITWFGQRNKIFNIHFRNIKGNRLEFSEVAPDEGDVDFARVITTLRDVGYSGMVQPDHNVNASGDTSQGAAYRAFVYGYIQAAIQAAAIV